MAFRRRKLEIYPPYVSMADIAFNLVLFFLIMAKTQDDSQLQWEPAKAADIKQIGSSRVSVTVDKNSRIYLNGKEIGTRELADAVAKQLEDNAGDKRIVLLKIHKETQASTFNPILEAVSQAGAEVEFVLEQEQ